MLQFDANIYAFPARAVTGPPVTVRGKTMATLRDPQGRPPIFDVFFPVSFEQAYEALVRLPRLDAEADGFFVVSGDADGRRWQLDGHLFDFNDQLHRVRLHGDCPAATLDSLLHCLGWPDVAVALEVINDGIVLAEAEFRRYAAT